MKQNEKIHNNNNNNNDNQNTQVFNRCQHTNTPLQCNIHCVQGPLWEYYSIRPGASTLPYYCAPVVCVLNDFEKLLLPSNYYFV